MANAPLTRIESMPMSEFIRRSEQDGPFELIDGEVVPKMPTVSIHNRMGKRIFLALLPYEQQGFGEVFQEATFVLTDNPQWVKGSRIPDVMFVSTARLNRFHKEIPDSESKPYILVPEIAVEIVSPTDHYSEIAAKVRLYLGDGVGWVWIVDPQTKEITVHTQGSNQQTILSGDAVLTVGDFLPGFALKLAELFQ